MANEVTGAAITAADVSIFRATNGVFDFLTAVDTKDGDSSPEQGAAFMAENDVVIVLIEDDADPSGGEDYYDRWYATNVKEGSTVYRISDANLQVVQSSPYKYRWNGSGVAVGTVHWTSGTTNYWDIGRLTVCPRTDDASLDQYMQWGGTTMASMTDGTTEIATSAAGTDVTLTTDVEDFKISLICDTASLAYAVPQYTISQQGEFQARKTYIMIATNCTAVSTSILMSEGWKVVSMSTLYANKAFYKEVSEIIPANGDKFSVTINIPFDVSAAAASTGYSLAYWCNDVQLESSVAGGAPTTSVPTVYGGVADYGIAAINNDETMTASSGIGATMTLLGEFTTAA